MAGITHPDVLHVCWRQHVPPLTCALLQLVLKSSAHRCRLHQSKKAYPEVVFTVPSFSLRQLSFKQPCISQYPPAPAVPLLQFGVAQAQLPQKKDIPSRCRPHALAHETERAGQFLVRNKALIKASGLLTTRETITHSHSSFLAA